MYTVANLGKGESICDRFCHAEGKIKNNDTGDVANNSYYQYTDDIAALKNLGVRRHLLPSAQGVHPQRQ